MRVLLPPNKGDGATHLVQVLGASAPIPVSGTRDERVAAIAATQRGRVRRSQLLAAGIGQNAIDRMVARGQLHREHRAVYAVAPPLEVPLGSETAALLACPEGALLSHRSAAEVWRLVTPSDHPIDVLIAGRQAGAPAGVRVHRTRSLLPGDMRIRGGLPVTSPARTISDLAAGALNARQVERALDEALVSRILHPAQLQGVLSRSTGRRGASLLRSLLARGGQTTLTRSQTEELFLSLVRQAGLPPPLVNTRLHGYEVDFLWPEQGLVVEIDTYRYHGTPAAFERDRRKAAVLTAAGLRVIRATGEQLEHEPLQALVAIGQTLARAA